MACLCSNQLDLAEPLNRWLLEKVAPAAEAHTKRFYGVGGIHMGTIYDSQGQMQGGPDNWLAWQYWVGGGGWFAQLLWQYYRYSLDSDYLHRAYPFMKSCLQFYENILERGADGRLHIPLSSSPEYFGHSLKAWTRDPACDLSIIRNLAAYCIAAAEALGTDEAQRGHWKALAAGLAPYPISEKTGLMVQPGTEYAVSHRHMMHLYPIYPGEDLTIEGTAADRQLIEKSLFNWLFRGTGEWYGWSFPYASLIAARLGRGNHALNLVEIYERAFVWPNGFHNNFDYKQTGVTSVWDSRGAWYWSKDFYTLDAECAFTAAINEMLLQSWGGKLRIFPAIPEAWADVSFENLRAEGALLVSAHRRGARVTRLVIQSERGGEVKIVYPLGPLPPDQKWEERTFHFQPGEFKELPVL